MTDPITPKSDTDAPTLLTAWKAAQARLKTGRIDVGFGRLVLDDPEVQSVTLLEEPIVAALPARHPLLRRKQLPLALLWFGLGKPATGPVSPGNSAFCPHTPTRRASGTAGPSWGTMPMT